MCKHHQPHNHIDTFAQQNVRINNKFSILVPLSKHKTQHSLVCPLNYNYINLILNFYETIMSSTIFVICR